MTFPPEVLGQLLRGYSKPADLAGPDGLLSRLTTALLERATSVNTTNHLSCDDVPPAIRIGAQDDARGIALTPRVANEHHEPLSAFDGSGADCAGSCKGL